MKTRFLTICLIAAGLFPCQAAVLITGFGSADLNPVNLTDDLQDDWAGRGSLTPTTFVITDANNVTDGLNGIYSDLTTNGRTPIPVGFGTSNLEITGTLTSTITASDQFFISLYDSDFNSLVYQFSWSSFSSGGSAGIPVASSLFATAGTFNGTVSSWALSVSGATGAGNVSFVFNNMRAVAAPEPSSLGLSVLAGAVTLGWWTRRRRNGP